MKIKAYFLSLYLVLCSVVAFAGQAPVAVLQQVSSQMIAELNRSQGHLNKQIINNIIRRVLLPHVDIESMSRSVVGREHWSQATPMQKEAFKRSFTDLLIKVYSAPLASYQGETIEFKPMRDVSAVRPQVESSIMRKNGQRIPVTYRMTQSDGAWKVYDFSVEGISLVNSYRSQFAPILQQKGLVGLLNRLRAQ